MSGCSTVIDRPSSGTDEGLQALSLEHLEAEICSLAGQIAAATCRLLLAIALYDRREGWAEWECHSMAHWLAWKCGMARATAREHVRVARSLEALPTLTSAFAVGRLSYSQVRALTRIATPATDETLTELAHNTTGGQLDRLVSAYRGVKAATLETAEVRLRRRGLNTYLDDDGMRVIIVRLPPEEGRAVLNAVEDRAAEVAKERQAATGIGAWAVEELDSPSA